MAYEKPEYGEPWMARPNDASITDTHGNKKALAYVGNIESPNYEIRNRIIVCTTFLAGIPTIELERLIALRADEHIRREIRDAYRASRWTDGE